MADVVAFVQNTLHFAYSACNALFTFNHRIVSALIRNAGDFYNGTGTVIRSLGAALLDIFSYIADFLTEALHVLESCFTLFGKFLLLVYYILSSLCVGVSFLLESIGAGFSHLLACLYDLLQSSWDYLTWLWGTTGADLSLVGSKFYQLFSAASTALTDMTLSILASVAKAFVAFFNTSGEIVNNTASYLSNVSLNATLHLSNSTAGLILRTGQTVQGVLCALQEKSSTTFVLVGQLVKQGSSVSFDAISGLWSQIINSIPVYLYILGTTLTIIIFKKVMDHLHKQGMTFPLFELTSSNRTQLNQRRRRRYTIDISDEESVSEEENLDEVEYQGQTVLDDVPLFDMGTDFGDNSDSEEASDTEEEETDDTEEDGVEEYEVISDSDSDEGSEAQINIELPERGGHYNLRTRASPLPAHLLSSSDLGKVLENERDKRLCVVCQDQVKNVLVLPCRHMCLCVDCAHELAVQRNHARRVCPLCRSRIETVMDVYV